MSLTKEQKEAGNILKVIEKADCKLPPKEKNILDWDMKELRAYIAFETKGMNPTKKMKWAVDLDKRIKEAKAKEKKLNSQNN